MSQTFTHDLADVGAFPLLEGMDGPADSGERGSVLAWHGRRFCQPALAAQHGAHGLIPETLLHGVREVLQLGTERRVRRHAAP